MASSMKMLIGIMAIAVIGIVLFAALRGGTGNNDSQNSRPAGSKIQEAYAFANSAPDMLNGVNCFCGCMQMVHNWRVHKRGLLDCYMKEDESYESHAAQCDMCINDALEVKALSARGMGKEEIKAKVYSKYPGMV